LALAHEIHIDPAGGKPSHPAVVESGQPLHTRFVLIFQKKNEVETPYLFTLGEDTSQASSGNCSAVP